MSGGIGVVGEGDYDGLHLFPLAGEPAVGGHVGRPLFGGFGFGLRGRHRNSGVAAQVEFLEVQRLLLTELRLFFHLAALAQLLKVFYVTTVGLRRHTETQGQ